MDTIELLSDLKGLIKHVVLWIWFISVFPLFLTGNKAAILK